MAPLADQLDDHHRRDDGDDDAGDDGGKTQGGFRAAAEDERVDDQPHAEDDDGEGQRGQRDVLVGVHAPIGCEDGYQRSGDDQRRRMRRSGAEHERRNEHPYPEQRNEPGRWWSIWHSREVVLPRDLK